jgi:nucleoside-diphosphate-sugar epimerase
MIEKNLKSLIHAPSTSLESAISRLYREGETICLVCDKNKKLLGILTRSDIKQAMLKGTDRRSPISSIMNKEFIAARVNTPLSALKKLARKQNPLKTGPLGQLPIITEEGKITGLYIDATSIRQATPSVLLTGGAGYVGSHVARKLLKKGYKVTVFDKLLFGNAGIKNLLSHKNFRLIQDDIADVGAVIKAIADADSVIHLAGIVGDPASSLDPIQTMEENHFATKNLVDISRYYGVSRFVFASSCSVYGSGKEILTENSKLQPVSLYAQSKLYSEREILSEKDKNFHPVILRFGTLYGLSPRMRFDLVANTMTVHATMNKRITVDGGGQWRPLLHVEDAASACVAALEAPLEKVSGEIFNVGDTEENYTILEVANMVKKAIPQAHVTELNTVRDRRDYRVSFTKINRVVGWKAKRKLEEGIKEVARAVAARKFPRWKDARYNNYLTLKGLLEESSS